MQKRISPADESMRKYKKNWWTLWVIHLSVLL
jgi:hypothetical protein